MVYRLFRSGPPVPRTAEANDGLLMVDFCSRSECFAWVGGPRAFLRGFIGPVQQIPLVASTIKLLAAGC